MRFKTLLPLLLAMLASAGAAKPQVPLEESCRAARAIVVVERTDRAGEYRVLHALYDGGGFGLKPDADMTVDLRGMVYEKGTKCILFMEAGGKAGTYRAVPQARTEDVGPTRQRVLAALRESGKAK